jgi:hypothetical protein
MCDGCPMKAELWVGSGLVRRIYERGVKSIGMSETSMFSI